MVIGERPMKPVSILILADAGAAGRELLVRRDVELGWALTVPEATAAIERRRPRVVVARADFAQMLLKEAASLLERVPVVVLLGPDDWVKRDVLFERGATALAAMDSRPRILETLSELTGLPTRYGPRVPYPEVVDVEVSGTRLYLEATELGTSGISIRDFPPARIGDRVEVTLVMMEPVVSFSGMVTRSRVGRSGAVTDVAFNALNKEERAFLETYVKKEGGRSAGFPEPIGLTSDITSGTFTLDLFQAVGENEGTDRWISLLRKRLMTNEEVKAPKWLVRVERELTEVERDAILGRSSPPFARAALEMRLDLARTQAVMVDPSSLRDSCELALDFCRTLAKDAKDAPPSKLAQVPDIRAGILSQVYGWTKVSGEGKSTSAA